MKTILVLACLLVLCNALIDDEVVMRRAKRQAMTYSDLRTLQCVRGCVLEFKDTLERMKQAKSTYFINEAILNKTQLDKLCGYHDQLDTCIAECNAESNAVSQNIVKMFESFDIICKTRYDEFVKYLRCYDRANKLTKERCSASCGDPEAFYTDIQGKMKNQMTQSDDEGVINAVNSLMKTTCDYASCHQRCQSLVIIEKCRGQKGQDAAEFISMFSEQSLKSVLQGLKVVAPQMVIPQDCLSRDEPSYAINRAERTEAVDKEDDEYD